MVKLFLTVEISDVDRKFHDDIMGKHGKWWADPNARPLAFKVLWRMLETRAKHVSHSLNINFRSHFLYLQLVEAGLLSGGPWEQLLWHEIGQILDPALHVDEVEKKAPAQKGKEGTNRSKVELQYLVDLLDEMGISDVLPSKADIKDLESIDQLTQTEIKLERLMDMEAEIVETQIWNHDAAQDLIDLSLKGNCIPFETCPEMFDLHPTANNESISKCKGKTAETTALPTIGMVNNTVSSEKGGQSSKGKKHTVETPPQRRSIYHLLPADAKDSWLGEPGESPIVWEFVMRPIYYSGHPIPPMPLKDDVVTFAELIDHSFPELFKIDAPHHDCIYHDLLFKFVKEDLRKQSMERLAGISNFPIIISAIKISYRVH